MCSTVCPCRSIVANGRVGMWASSGRGGGSVPESRALPYFERRTTLDAIASLAEQRSIVIYAGAGVSIEKTDLTWPRIVDELLRRRIGDDRLSATVRTENPLQSASIVKQMYIAGYSDPDTLLADDLRSLLYPQ